MVYRFFSIFHGGIRDGFILRQFNLLIALSGTAHFPPPPLLNSLMRKEG